MSDRIKTLLSIGLNALDSNGNTPLMLAAWEGDLKMVKHLIGLGADPSLTDDLGKNVLHFAADQKSLGVLEAVLGMNINVDLRSEGGYKQTALFIPAAAGNTPVVQMLLKHGANPNIQDKYKMTALHWALQKGEIEAVKMLLSFKADVNTKNNKNVTPLMSASIEGTIKCVQLLADAGAEINASAKDGFTALMFAAYYGKTKVIQYLLTQGANRNAISKKGETALSIAEKKGLTTL
jgi:ankyrin repeat protein